MVSPHAVVPPPLPAAAAALPAAGTEVVVLEEHGRAVVEEAFAALEEARRDGLCGPPPLDFSSFAALFGPLALEGTPASLLRCLFAAADVDGDGRLSAAELVALHATLARGSCHARGRLGFSLLAAMRDGANHEHDCGVVPTPRTIGDAAVGREEVLAFAANAGAALEALLGPTGLKLAAEGDVGEAFAAVLGLPANDNASLGIESYAIAAERPDCFEAALRMFSSVKGPVVPPAFVPEGPGGLGATPMSSEDDTDRRASPSPIVFGWQALVALRLAHALELTDIVAIEGADCSPGDFASAPSMNSDGSVAANVLVPFTQGKVFAGAPNVYGELRRLCGLPPGALARSLGIRRLVAGLPLGRWDAPRTWRSEARGGQIFFASNSGAFLAKTLPSSEHGKLAKMLPDYLAHLRESPGSLLVRYFAQYDIEVLEGGFPCRVAIMENTLHSGAHERYDLKGCYHRDDSNSGLHTDKDWHRHARRVRMCTNDADALTMQLGLDLKFLRDQGVMDYSILVGIRSTNVSAPCGPALAAEHADGAVATSAELLSCGAVCRWRAVQSVDGSEVYSLAIIDLLTCFDWKKRAEIMLKRPSTSAAMGPDHGVVPAPPDKYAKRLAAFVSTDVLAPAGTH